ncbi:MAG: TonB-dependent receptor [Saprospiraceae bacterium]|nr:TonB-dependent receptor [Saprospiraceae bacterium]
MQNFYKKQAKVKTIFCVTIMILGLIATNNICAQTSILQGKLKDTKGADIFYASVIVKDSKKGAISDEKGNFIIENVPIGKQTLLISSVGYEPASQEILVNEGMNTLTFSLKESINTLSEVSVVGNIGVTEVKPQSIKYKAKDLISQNGGTAGDILKAMPSVAMGGSPNHNRDIRFRGLGNGYTQVLINGQPVGVNGNNRGDGA